MCKKFQKKWRSDQKCQNSAEKTHFVCAANRAQICNHKNANIGDKCWKLKTNENQNENVNAGKPRKYVLNEHVKK